MLKQLSRQIRLLESRIIDDAFRYRFQMTVIFGLLAAVAAFMTIVNVFTQRNSLMWATLIFSLFCLVNLLLLVHTRLSHNATIIPFALAIFALFAFFITSGRPEGFSVLWCCLLPTTGLLLFGRRLGSIFSGLMWLMLVFFFYTPWGAALLQYDYTDSFRLRFPLLFLAFYLLALFLETVRELTQDALQRSRLEYQLLYTNDALTGLYNRYGFQEQMDLMLAQWRRQDDEAAFVFMILDLDEFKRINDQYGHANGDVALRRVAQLITQAAGAEACVCRWGGEEFAVFLTQPAHREGPRCRAEKLRQAVEDAVIQLEEGRVSLTVSIGAISTTSRPTLPNRMVNLADQCLYQAKEQGRNRCVCRVIDHND